MRIALSYLLIFPVISFAQELKGGKDLPPEPEKEAKAQLDVKSAFGADIAKARSSAAKKALAEKMLSIIKEESTATRWVLCVQARELAASAGDVALAVQAIEQQTRLFVVSRHALNADLAEKLVQTAPGRAAVDFIYAAAESAIDGDDFKSAVRLLNAGLSVARNNKKEAGTERRFEARMRSVQDMVKAIDEAKGDQAEVGKVLCFRKLDWAKGLPMLAKTKDQDLLAVVKKDLANPTGAERADLGDAWFELAEKAKGEEKFGMLRRALFWHRLGYSDAGGLKKAKLDARIKEEMERIELEDVKMAMFTVWAGKWSVKFDEGSTHLYRITPDGRLLNHGRITPEGQQVKLGSIEVYTLFRVKGKVAWREDGKMIEWLVFTNPVTVKDERFHPTFDYDKPDHTGTATWEP